MREKKVRKLKKSFAVDPHSYEVIRRFTEAHGLSMSSWLTGLLNEVAKQIEGQPSAFDKPVREMTIGELSEALKYWTKSIEAMEEQQ